MPKELIQTTEAPESMGCYSQAIRSGTTVYLSGQIPLDPKTGKIVEGDFRAQVVQVFKNLEAVAKAAAGDLNAIVKLTVFLTDMSSLAVVNEVMETCFSKPYPARSSMTVAALPKGVPVEIEAIMALSRGQAIS